MIIFCINTATVSGPPVQILPYYVQGKNAFYPKEIRLSYMVRYNEGL